MKERPILFSAPMVRAILDGRKTQTRRAVKIPKDEPLTDLCWGYTAFTPERHISFRGLHANGQWGESFVRQPYCKGDRLWVRETWAEFLGISETPTTYIYRADGTFNTPAKEHLVDGKWRPSIFMPRAASRITLEITAVRVERLQDISRADIDAEGVLATDEWIDYEAQWAGQQSADARLMTPHEYWAERWNRINGKKHPWDNNPWVWVVEFKMLSARPD